MKLLVSALLALILGQLESAFGGSPQSEAERDRKLSAELSPCAREELLGELPAGIKVPAESNGMNLSLSPDGRRFAEVGQTDKKKWVVVIDGKVGPEFEEFRYSDKSRGPGVGYFVQFSPDSQHAAYSGHSGENKWVVMLDGKAQREMECAEGSYNLPLRSFSPNGQHFAFQAKRCPNNWLMMVDGEEGPEFSYLSDPVFSPDSQHFAYVALTPARKKIVVLDHQPGPEFQELGEFVFSPDSQHMAYSVLRNVDKWAMVVDGKAGPEFLGVHGPAFSPNSQHIAYRARVDQRGWVAVLDGKPGPEFDEVGEGAIFSPDSKHLAYKAKTSSGKWVVVLDGQSGHEFEKIVKGPFFGPFGNRLAYEVLEGAKDFIVFDDKADTEYDAVPNPKTKSKQLRAYVPQWISGISGINFSPNGQHLAYIARRGQKFVVSRDREAGPEFSFIVAGPLFSSDSEHLAYIGWDPKRITVVADGKIVRELSVPAGAPLYTPIRQQATVDRFTAWDEAAGGLAGLPLAWPILLGGELFAHGAAKEVNFVEHLTFSPDSQHLAFVLGHGGRWFSGEELSRAKRQAIVDGQEGHQYDADALLNLTFSSDGKHFAYEVQKADKGKSFVVVDGHEGKAYEELLARRWGSGSQVAVRSTLRLDEKGSITYLAREGRKFFRVTQPLP